MFITRKELNRRIQEAVEKDRKRMKEEEYIGKRFAADLERELEYIRKYVSDMIFTLEQKVNEHLRVENTRSRTVTFPVPVEEVSKIND